MTTTPYDEIAKTPMAGATKDDAPALLDEGRRLVQAGVNYVDGGNRRIKLAQELLTCPKTGEIPCECPPVDAPQPDDPPGNNTYPLDPIPSEFDVQSELLPTSIAPSAAPDVFGAFRFLSRPSHNAYADPIVFPGQQPAGHLHTFFGNTLTDGNSTYESLRTTGDSTSHSRLNRSAYWIPSMMNGEGQVVMPRHIAQYYKGIPASSPKVAEFGAKASVAQPDGIKYIVGATMDGSPANAKFDMVVNDARAYNSWQALLAAEDHSQIKFIKFRFSGPDCWDGENLDSNDHRSHVSFMYRDGNGEIKVPETHPYLIPKPSFSFKWEFEPTDRLDLFHFSSDDMAGTDPCMSLHFDLFDAWDPVAKQLWTDHAINGLRNCSDGDLGNGQIMKRNEHYPSDDYERLVPVPNHGHEHH